MARPILIGRPGGDRRAAEALRPVDPAGRGLRADQSRGRPALPRLRRDVSRSRRPQGHHARCGAHAGAHQHDRHRGARGAARRCRRHDLRARGPLPLAASATSATSSAWRPAASAFSAMSLLITSQGRLFPRRHACPRGPDGRGDRGDRHRLRRRTCGASASSPKIALLSHSDFGSTETRLRAQDARALALVQAAQAPDLEIDGEMQADTALMPDDPRQGQSARRA